MRQFRGSLLSRKGYHWKGGNMTLSFSRVVFSVALLVSCLWVTSLSQTNTGVRENDLSKRIEEEFRLFSRIPQSFSVRILNIGSSEIANFDQGKLQYGQDSQIYEAAFYLSHDRRFLFFGNVVNLTIDRRVQNLKYLSTQDEFSRGNLEAPITIVEFSDFQCPACGHAYSILELVMQKYEGKVRFVFKHLPLVAIHDWAETAAIASECGGMQRGDAFWRFYDAFFLAQDEIKKANIDQKALDVAKESTLDLAEFRDCVQRKRALPRIAKSIAEARALEINGTPAFFINGQRLADHTFSSFKKLIDQELELARSNRATAKSQ